jgi:hypothetical protein
MKGASRWFQYTDVGYCSSTANCHTKFPAIFRWIFGILSARYKLFTYTMLLYYYITMNGAKTKISFINLFIYSTTRGALVRTTALVTWLELQPAYWAT